MRLQATLLLLLLACTEEKAVEAPALEVSPLTLDLGAVAVGDVGEATFTVSNTGGGVITLLSASLVDGDPEAWDVERDDQSELGAGVVSTVTVSFGPDAEGATQGRVQVRTDFEGEGTLYIDLSGRGSASIADADEDGYSPATGDCNDEDGTVHPGADELCDGKDNDCNGVTPADEIDEDFDGYRLCSFDCDDADNNVHPNAAEICDGKDSDCDGVINDETDADMDGISICNGDCDDTNENRAPGLIEVCDGRDNNCDGETDDIDVDTDGHSPCSTGGDCDDTDPLAHPVVVSVGATGTDGDDEDPVGTIEEALELLDEVCRTVVLMPGTHTVSTTVDGLAVSIVGGGSSPEMTSISATAPGRPFTVKAGSTFGLYNLTILDTDVTGDGGAVWAVGSDVTVESVNFQSNQATGDGGAIALTSGTLTLTDVTFFQNVALDDGGAVAIVSGDLIDTDSAWIENSGMRGGALLADASDVTILDSLISHNTANDVGGGLALTSITGLYIEDTNILLNESFSYGGGVAFTNAVPTGTALFRNNIVQDNAAMGLGGGAAITGAIASFSMINNSFVGNEGVGEGAGIYIGAADTVGLMVWSNLVMASYGDSGLYLAPGGLADVAWNSAWFTSSGIEFGGDLLVDEDENQADNPLFVYFTNNGNPTDDDLDLSAGSPVIDAGPEDTGYNDPDGTRNDRGYTGGPGAGE